MDELIGRLVANIGIDRAAAVTAAGIIAQFPHRERAAEHARAFIACVPRADEPMSTARTDSNAPGLFGALWGAEAAGSRVIATWPSMSPVQAVARKPLEYAREKAGEDAVGDIVGAIPGLSQLV